jgi:nitrite reductase/ring-hydroxylating ferredoxin subunit
MLSEIDPELHTIPPDRGTLEDQPKWRQDFPTDTAQDGYVARREFTKFLGLTSLAFVVGQFWIALENRWRRIRGELPILLVAELANLPVGSARMFNYPSDKDPAIFVRPDANTLLAYSSQCTHLQCPVLPQLDAGKFHCPCHAGYFDLRTGRPLSGPPRRPLAQIALEIRDGKVFATGFQEPNA